MRSRSGVGWVGTEVSCRERVLEVGRCFSADRGQADVAPDGQSFQISEAARHSNARVKSPIFKRLTPRSLIFSISDFRVAVQAEFTGTAHFYLCLSSFLFPNVRGEDIQGRVPLRRQKQP